MTFFDAELTRTIETCRGIWIRPGHEEHFLVSFWSYKNVETMSTNPSKWSARIAIAVRFGPLEGAYPQRILQNSNF